MKPIATAGVALALVVGVLMFVNGFGGLYKNPSMGWVFPVFATLIEVGVLIWGLKRTAREGRGYGGQVGAGLLIALIGGALIVPLSLIWVAMFPDVFEFAAAAMADGLADRGQTEEQIRQTLEMTAFTRTAWFQAVFGFLATMVTGLVASMIIAVFVRKKD